MVLEKCTLIDLPRINDVRGSLTFIEGKKHIPFAINRVYYLYDVPENVERGGHAHKALQQIIIAISGSFDIHLDDGYSKKTLHMSGGDTALYVCPMIWREIDNFSAGTVCMVLASEYYDEADYYRDYEQFTDDVKKANK